MSERIGAEGYVFENFTLNLQRGSLMSNGVERPLRRQSMLVLLYLLKHPGVLVYKNELASDIWHDTAVTDNALVQCIVEIRRALRDDPRKPRFIKTVPKVGYIFLAEVAPLYSRSDTSSGNLLQSKSEAKLLPPAEESTIVPLDIPVQAVGANTFQGSYAHRSTSLRHSFPVGMGIVAACMLLVLVGALGGRKLFRQWSQDRVGASSTSNRPTVAIMYFENKTGDPSLNWLCEGLADMMIADLGSTEEMNVLSRAQLHALFPGWGSNSSVSPETAQRVGQRANADTVVLGSFSGVGSKLTLRLAVYDGRSGRHRGQEQSVVTDQQEIVVQAHLLSVRLASDLGMHTVLMSSLPDVMTTNADAYRYYSLGVEKVQNFQNTDAIGLLKKAIELDPHFAMAYARIGYAYAVTDLLPARGRPYLEKALQLSSTLPEKDRFYVQAWNAIARGEYSSAIGIFYQLIDTYPGESEAYCQLGRLLRGEEKSAEAIAVLRRGLENSPNSANLYNVLGVVLMGEYKYAEALDAEKHALMLSSHDDPNAHDSLGMAYEQSGDYYGALSEFSEALALDPEFEPSIGHLADTYFQIGRYHDAVREYQRYIRVTGSDAARAMGYSNLVTIYRAAGDLTAAQTAATMETRLDSSAIWDGILVALDRGQGAKVSSLERLMLESRLGRERGSQPNVRTQFYNRGYLAMRRGDKSGAIMNYQIALQHWPPTSGIDPHEDCLANAYLEFGMWREAVAEYTRIQKLNPNYPLVEYHLAVAYAHLNNAAQSRDAYTRFLHTWQSADPDLPEVKEAKSKVSAA